MCGCGCELVAALAEAKAQAKQARADSALPGGQPEPEWRGWWTELKALVHDIARPIPTGAGPSAGARL